MTTFKLQQGEHYFSHESAEICFDFTPSLQERTDLVLICINGFQRTKEDFKQLRNRLQNALPHLATLSLDNRGAGKTKSREEGLTLELMSEDVSSLMKKVCEALGLKSYCTLGISMGGMISQILALNDPHLKAQILVSTTAKKLMQIESFPKEYEALYEMMKGYVGKRFLKDSPLLFKTIVNAMLRKLNEPNTQPLLENSKSSAFYQYEAIKKMDLMIQISKIKIPTLIINGGEDQVVSPEEAKNLHKNIKDSEIKIFPEAGHLLLAEEPIQFAETVTQFLKNLK